MGNCPRSTWQIYMRPRDSNWEWNWKWRPLAQWISIYNLEVLVDNTLHERKEKNTVELNRAKEELISTAKEELEKQFSKQSILKGTPKIQWDPIGEDDIW